MSSLNVSSGSISCGYCPWCRRAENYSSSGKFSVDFKHTELFNSSYSIYYTVSDRYVGKVVISKTDVQVIGRVLPLKSSHTPLS